MYAIKQNPTDFIVVEIINLKLDETGEHAYFWLNKKDYNTVNAIERVSGFLNIPSKNIGFAGNKDKQAVTRQAISIKDPGRRIGKDRFQNFNSDLISLEYIGRGKGQIYLGQLEGNSFEIIVRDCDKEPTKVSQFINYFDEQRFSETNKEVGKAIVKGELKRACELILADCVKAHLLKNPNDFVGAMTTLPLKVRQMHIHAYQSYIWNETVAEYLKRKYKELTFSKYSLGELAFPNISTPIVSVPIVGFSIECEDEEMMNIVHEIMKKEKIQERDFIIKSMPELSVECGKRDIAVEIKGLEIEKKDEKTFLLKFSLQKGSYATMAVKRMMA